MRTETMIAGAVALVSGYLGGEYVNSVFYGHRTPILPSELFQPVGVVFVASAFATVWLGAEDLTNYAVRGNPRQFKPLTCGRR